MIKVAINGFGRIGRLCFRLMEENEEFGNRCEYALIDSVVLNEDSSPKEYSIDYLKNILSQEKSKQKIKKKWE